MVADTTQKHPGRFTVPGTSDYEQFRSVGSLHQYRRWVARHPSLVGRSADEFAADSLFGRARSHLRALPGARLGGHSP